jgi:hypothetical protein
VLSSIVLRAKVIKLAKKESEKQKYLPKCFADCGFYTIFARRNSHRLTEIT